jgi:poly(3-hydroxybutyrate) depolymerase
MLYHLYEMQRSAVAPWRVAADISQRILKSPLNPFGQLPSARAMAAGLDIFEQTTRRYGKPKFGLNTTTVKGVRATVEEDSVLRKTFCQLKYFRRSIDSDDPKLLIVAPMSGHFATLLRGTVEAMLPDHHVYITDWRDAREVPVLEGKFDLSDYVAYVTEFLEFLGPNTHVMAVCQPAVPVMAAVSLMSADKNPAVPASMTLMGGPIDTRINPTSVNEFATSRPLSWFEHNVISRVPFPHAGAFRRVYPGFLQLAGFLAMNLERHMDAHWEMFLHLVDGDDESTEATRAFYEEYMAVMDMPAEYYLETIEQVFQEYHLPRGLLKIGGRLVEPQAITRTALLTIEGERDDISAVGQTKAAHDLCTGLRADQKMHYEQKAVGHYGIFNGRKWRTFIAPKVKDFIRAHDQR